MKIRRAEWILSWVGVLVLVVVPTAFGAVQGQLYGFHPYISLQEEYSDNIYLTQDNTKGDFITTVYPGLKYKAEGGGYKFELDYSLGLNFYALDSQNDYISHKGSLKTYYSFNPRWTFRLNDALTRSREAIEPYTTTTPTGEQSNVVTSTGQNLYLRHIFEPVLEYKFGKEDLILLQYRNMIYRTEEGTVEDSTENAITPHLAYWFNIRNGINLDYIFSTAEFRGSPNWVGNDGAGKYLYRFNPRTTVFGAYSFSMRDFEAPGIDYSIHSPRIGVEHAFSPTLNGSASLGWFWQVIDTGASFEGPVYNLSITQRSQRTDYTLALQGGYREQYFTAEKLGFSRFHQASVIVAHRLQEKMSVGLTGTLVRDEYQNPDHIAWTWGLVGSFSYQAFKWLTVSLEISTRARDSDLSGNNYQGNRGFLKLTAEF